MNIGLPKWPALVVVGKPITPELAAQVLLRTQDRYSCNDHQFAADAYEATGMPLAAEDERFGYAPRPEGFDYNKHWEKIDAERRRVGKLELSYLHNDRIVSSWIGGPKGWCDWDGTIGCNTFNIGKWPSVGEVEADWLTIAHAFPTLDLTAQLWNCEAGFPPEDEPARPLVEFRVVGGQVETREPQSELTGIHKADVTTNLMAIVTSTRDLREVGVPGATRQAKLDYLRWAAGLVEESMK